MVGDLASIELARVVDEVCLGVIRSAGIVRPPVNALSVAESLGLTVAWDERQRGRARLIGSNLAGSRRGMILLRPDPRQERRQWAVAHEIGEHLAGHVFDRLGTPVDEVRPAERESVANLLSGRVLIPTVWFAKDAARCSWDLATLKQRYETASHELIARRMLEFAVPILITVFDQGQVTFRRGNTLRKSPPLCPDEICAQQRAQDTGAAVVQHGEVAVHAWPVHEAHWKREILRTVMPEPEFP